MPRETLNISTEAQIKPNYSQNFWAFCDDCCATRVATTWETTQWLPYKLCWSTRRLSPVEVKPPP